VNLKTRIRKQKAILIVTNDLVTDQRVNKIASTLTNNGFDVLLLGRYLKPKSDYKNDEFPTKRFSLFFNKGMLFYAEFNIRLFFFLLFAKADVFTSNDLDTLLGTYLANIFRRKRLVYDSHEYFTEVPELLENKTAKKVWTAIEKHIVPKLKHASTVCKSIADIYSDKYGVDFKVVRNVPMPKPVAQTINKEEIAKGKKVIIYQGAVNVGRGIELIIDSMSYTENWIFLIVGGGDKEKELRNYVDKKGLTDKVVFTGRLHFTELWNYTNIADVGISLEENLGLNYYYALPNKLFDYIQAYVPILSSDLPEIQRIVQEYGLGRVIEKRDAEYIAQLLDTEFVNGVNITKWKENLKNASQELTWENEERILISLYT